MMYEDNDTLNKGQQNKNQSNADKTKNKDAMTAKLLASMAAGLAVGAGAAYAAQTLHIGTNEPATEEATTEEPQTTPEATAAAEQSAKPTVEERVERLEEKERIREQKEQAQQKQETETHPQKPSKPEPDPKPEPEDVFRGREVKIESVKTRTLEDGTTVQIYSGTVDGHQARFLANSNGQVIAATVDENDNGNVDDNEVIDLRESNMTTQYLAQHQVAPSNDHEVTVIAVEHDVEFGGETVDIAIVSMDDQPVMFIDRNQNGEVDVAIADQNHNGNIDEGEMQDVSGAHITMPTEDDITGNITANVDDNAEDYSNNADVTVYDV